MPTTTITPDQDAIISEVEIAAPASRIFKALTHSDQLVRWFTDAACPVEFWKMEPHKGGVYSYATEKGSHEVNEVSEFRCQGEILEFDPPRLLAYTWIANWHLDKQRKTIVHWELTPTAKGTHVRVTHSGLAQEAAARQDYHRGWPGVLTKLKRFAEAKPAEHRVAELRKN